MPDTNSPEADEQILPDKRFDYWAVQMHLARYEFAGQFVENKIVFDIACGAGYGTAHLRDKGARNAVGGDISTVALNSAKRLYKKLGVDFFLLDATRLPFISNSFDAIVSFETIEHIYHYENYLMECCRVLKDGGIFICSTPNKLPGQVKWRFHAHEFYLEEFKTTMEKYFSNIQYYGQGYRNDKTEIQKSKLVSILQKLLSPMNYHLPRVYKLLSLVYEIVTSRYRTIRLADVQDYSKIIFKEHMPYALHVSGSNSPRVIIAIAMKK